MKTSLPQMIPAGAQRTLKKGFVVIVDDDAEHRSMLRDFIASLDYHVQDFESAEQALSEFKSDSDVAKAVDLVITDLKMPEMDGLEFIEFCKKVVPEAPCILITAFASIETAIEATKKGTFDFIVKPFELSKIQVSVDRAVKFSRLKKENHSLRSQVLSNSSTHLIGKSKEIQRVFDLSRRVANATANVLIMGESGTGKELIARTIHESGARKEKPFIAINCTAIPDTLLESELFGHAKGAFTGAVDRKKGLFEEAQGGTLFLDEIGDLEPSLQAKILRALQEKKIKPIGDAREIEIDVRIIAATHKDLKGAIRDGRFREDLYYRLCVIPISLPPLRHRKEDIPLLVHHFLKKYCDSNGLPLKDVSPSALRRLMDMPWEGNVRELENMIERLVVLVEGDVVGEDDIPTLEARNSEDFIAAVVQDLPTLQEIERRYIKMVLERTGGRKDKASHILGINRRTLYRKEREYDLVELERKH